MPTSPLLRRDYNTPTVHVRVCPDWVVLGRDDHAPSVGVNFVAGQEIPNLDAYEAKQLIAIGAVVEVN